MTNFIIRSHVPGKTYKNAHFFILNKGNNSGKPLKEAFANCFVIIFSPETDSDSYYWLAYSLWKSQYWHPFLVGSVIPFLRITCFKSNFSQKTDSMLKEHELQLKNVAALKLLEQQETKFYQNLALISDLRRVILYRYIHKK